MNYFQHILVLICIYTILSASANLTIGYGGLLCICQSAFWGIGAYVAALMGLRGGTPFLFNTVCAMGVCGICGAVVGAPSLRIRNDFFVIATFAFQIIAFSILNNWVSFTGGPLGLSGIPQPVILGWRLDQLWEFLILAGVCAVLALWVCTRIIRSPIGRALKAIREDEAAAVALGKNVFRFKVMVFAIGAGLAGLAGVVYAYYISFIDPTSFTVMESIFILSMVILGGAGSLWGPVIGAILLVSLPEVLRFIGLPSSVAANVRQILYGMALVACMLWRPQGLIGEFSFSRNEQS